MGWESLRKTYVSMLSQQGLQPEVDTDGDIHFMYQGRNYYVTRHCDDGYYELLFPDFWQIESPEELTRAGLAAAKVTSRLKATKVYLNSSLDNVSAEACGVISAPSDVSGFFDRALGLLEAAAQEFANEMVGGGQETCLLEIHAVEGKFPAGRSLISNLLGGASLANWKFSGRVTGGDLQGSAEVYFGEFQTTYGIPMEVMSGIDRKQAQDVLNGMHRMIIKDGWRQVESGPYWYSNRYVADSSILDKIAE